MRRTMRIIQKAIENYSKAAERNTDPKWKKSSLEYLAAAYDPTRWNDPAKAEPVYQQIIQMEPSEPANYMALSKLYEDAGRYEDAEAQLQKAERPSRTKRARLSRWQPFTTGRESSTRR